VQLCGGVGPVVEQEGEKSCCFFGETKTSSPLGRDKQKQRHPFAYPLFRPPTLPPHAEEVLPTARTSRLNERAPTMPQPSSSVTTQRAEHQCPAMIGLRALDALNNNNNNNTNNTTDPPPSDDWAVQIATALPEVWALVAENGDGLVAAWRLTSVCKAARVGVMGWLRTLQSPVVCGGRTQHGQVLRDVLRLDLATLRWEPMPPILGARYGHACCAVRGTVVVLGGTSSSSYFANAHLSSVEMFSEEDGAFVSLPPLSCGPIRGAAALAVEESESAAGQVLLLGGASDFGGGPSAVQLVDLATGMCTPHSNLRGRRMYSAAARVHNSDRIICAGGIGDGNSSAEIYGPPGALDQA
jgi:hypothetical protein